VKTVKKGGDRLDMVDLEEKGMGWAIAAVFGFVTGVGALAAILVRKKKKEKGE
jgi:hypothetical protein